jgi:putative tricarboxylic transport membrane protein
MDVIFEAALLLLDKTVIITMILTAIFGLAVGSIPGLTASMAVALLIPLTFFMDPVPALAGIVSVAAMAIFAGDLPGALLRIPGTPASAAYADEAFAMTRKGKAELALGLGLICSAIGGLFGSTVLILGAPLLAEIALKFSSYEYFWLACLGLTAAVVVAKGDLIKGMAALLFGLILATIGLDPVSGLLRFTFDVPNLVGGLGFIPVLIGLFAVSEIMRSVTRTVPQTAVDAKPLGNVFSGIGKEIWRLRYGILRGCGIGTIIGAIPGAGADIAAYVSYAIAKKFSRRPEAFGTGITDGLASATAANNSAIGGAFVPATVFGVPGDSLTAIVIGVLYMKGLTPGPTVFLQDPQLIYAVFLSFFVANIFMVPFGFVAIKVFKQVLRIPQTVLMPMILAFCMVGSFAVENAIFAVTVMLILGLIGYLMEENGFPLAPAILGLVLGPMLEEKFLTSMLKSKGDFSAFFERPVAGALGVITIIIWLSPLLIWFVRRIASSRRKRNVKPATRSS